MKKAVCTSLLVLCTCIAAPVYAQSAVFTSAEQHRADSLLYALDFDALRALLDQQDTQLEQANASEAERAAYDQQVDDYRDVLETVEAVADWEADYTRDYAMQRVEFREQYQPVQAGDRAAALYEAFERRIRVGQFAEAVPPFEAARLFRNRHLAVVRQRLDEAYARAQAAFAAQDYASARATIDSVTVYFGSNNLTHRPLIEQLDALSIEVNQILGEQERQERYWERTERPALRFGVGLTSQVLVRSAVGPVTLMEERGDSTIPLEYEGFDQGSAITFGGEVYGYVSSNLTVGVGAAAGSYGYDNKAATSPFFFDFAMQSRAAYAFARYLFRSTVGVRPYARVGGGLISTRQERSEVAFSYTDPDTQIFITERFNIAEDSQSGGQLHLGAGFEYLPCATCKLVVGGELGGVRNFLDNDLLPSWQSALSVRVGVNL